MSASDLIASSTVAAVVSNPRLPDNPIVECNPAFIALTGYSRDEIIGQNCRFLRGPDTEAALTEELRDGIRNKRPTMVEILNYKKDGTPFRNAVMVAPIFDADGHLEYFLGSQMEINPPADGVGEDRRNQARQRIEELTPRQKEILIEIARGKLNKQIAYELDLSERTIKMHRAALLRTLGIRTTAEAIRVVIEAGY